MVKIDAVDKDMFLLRELCIIVIDISRLWGEDLVSEVTFDNKVEVFVCKLMANMWSMVE